MLLKKEKDTSVLRKIYGAWCPHSLEAKFNWQSLEVISESICRPEPHWWWLIGALTLISLKSVLHKPCTDSTGYFAVKDIERDQWWKRITSPSTMSQWAKGEPLGIDASRRLGSLPGGCLSRGFTSSPYLIFYLLAWPMASAVWVNVWGLLSQQHSMWKQLLGSFSNHSSRLFCEVSTLTHASEILGASEGWHATMAMLSPRILTSQMLPDMLMRGHWVSNGALCEHFRILPMWLAASLDFGGWSCCLAGVFIHAVTICDPLRAPCATRAAVPLEKKVGCFVQPVGVCPCILVTPSAPGVRTLIDSDKSSIFARPARRGAEQVVIWGC